MFDKVKSFFFRNTSARQTVAKNTFWLTVSNFGGRLLRAVIIIYATRVLGASSWGAFNYAITVVAFLGIFTDLGIGRIVIREVSKAKDEHERRQILSTALHIKLALMALGIGITLFIAPHITTLEGAKALYPIMGLVLAFDLLREFGFAYLRGVERMEAEAFLFLLTNLAIVGFGFVFLMKSPTAYSFAIAYALGTAIGAAATFFVLRHKLSNFFSRFSLPLAQNIFKNAWPLAIASFMSIFLTNTDTLILGWFKNAEEVGFYGADLRIVQLLYLIPLILATTASPLFSRLAHEGAEKMRRVLESMMSFAFLAALPLAVGGSLLGKEIVVFLFGTQYLPAAPAFQVLMVNLLIDFSSAILVAAMIAKNGQKNIITYSAIAAAGNVILDLILIPRFGAVGSAGATLIAQIISTAYLWYTVNRIQPFKVASHLTKGIAATLSMAIVVLLLKTVGVMLPVTIALSGLVYVGLLFLLKEPLLHEIRTTLRPNASIVQAQHEPVSG